jgi:hypothetical protein
MDPLAYAAVCRAQDSLSHARQYLGASDHRALAKGFVDMCATIARAKNSDAAVGYLQASKNERVQKAASAHVTFDSIWQAVEAQQMAQAFIVSAAEPDLLTAISRYARTLPKYLGRVLIAGGAVGDVVAEGHPKAIKNIELNVGSEVEYIKSCALAVFSAELLGAVGDAGRALFEGELVKAVVRAANAAVVASLIDSNTTSVPAGANPLESLRNGLNAAGASDGYVVVAPAQQVAWLATAAENKGGMGVRGGTFIAGVELVAVDSATQMAVIPASKLVILDGGLEVRPSDAAAVSMADSPTSPSTLVSLWQANCVGLLVERGWRLDGDKSGIVLVG